VGALHGALAFQHAQVAPHGGDRGVHHLAQLLQRGELHLEEMVLNALLSFFRLHDLS
jgi:hypothetical protein